MSSHTTCPSCGARYRVTADLVGKSARCKKCNAKFRIASGAGVLIDSGPDSSPHDDPALADKVSVEWRVGDVILNLYEVTALLGEGGMGKVYKVHHREWNVDLAVKSPRAEMLAKSGAVENFEREAEVWVNLGLHPNIACCYYVRRLGGIPRVFAEYVDGGNLAEWIRDGRLYEGTHETSLVRILDVAIQFAWGLHYAHELGLVHQDVKPANVLIAMPPSPASQGGAIAKVTDFGLAKARAPVDERALQGIGRSILVSTGGMTLAYCSPEQANRQAISRKTDMWSWAVSVLEMFSGEVTWPSGTAAAEALESYLETGIENTRIPPMPAALATLLRRCFQMDPQARPQDMLGVAAVLRELFGATCGRAYPRSEPRPAEALADSLNNHAVSLLDLKRYEEAERFWQRALELEPHHPEATFNRGLHLWRSGKLSDTALVQQLEEVRTSHAATWRDEYLLALVHLERADWGSAWSLLEPLLGAGEVPREIRQTVARMRNERLAAGRELDAIKSERRLSSLSMSAKPGGRVVAGTWEGTVEVWDLTAGKCVQSLAGHRGRVNSVAVDATARLCVSGGEDDRVFTWDLDAGKPVRNSVNGTGEVLAVAVSPDGGSALAGGKDGTIHVWDLGSGKCIRKLVGHRFHVLTLAVTADGKRVLSGGRDRVLRVWELATGRLLQRLEGHESDIAMVTVTTDGTRALSASHDGTIRVWDLTSGTCLQVLAGHTDWVRSVTVDSTGKTAVSGGSDGTLPR